MPALRSIAFLLAAGASCLGQPPDEKKLLERVLAKPDMSLMNPMNEKKFDGGGFLLKKNSGTPSFVYDQKLSTGKYHNLRSFFGLKNPWFGKRVYEPNKANLWSKSLIVNADAKIPLKTAQTQKFYQAEKKASKREEPVRTSAYLGRGVAQGKLDQVSDKIDKNMTIEEVREILNKDR